MKQIKTISIKCETKDYLKLEDMTVMQGNLKLREDADYEKIKKSILTYSFSFPFFIWRSGKTNYLIDGTGRHDCLLKMQEEGYLIPELPVVYIQCKNKAEAKQKLLRLNSQYGKMTKESVLEFAEDIDLNFDEIALPDSVIDFSLEEVEDTECEEDRSGNLVKNYTVPPFSILDTRQKYWQDRKKWWLEKTGNLSETRDGEFGRLGANTILDKINGGTSNFDPVFAEVMYKWFCRGGGRFSTHLAESRRKELLQAS